MGAGLVRVYLVAGGPSAASFDPRRKRGLIVGINDSAMRLPRCDVAFSADCIWVERRRGFLSWFGGRKVVAAPLGWRTDLPVEVVERRDGLGISEDPSVCFGGDNSGFAALSWAVANSFRDIVLVGYDLSEKGHWHDGYEWVCRKGAADYPSWVRYLEIVAPHYAAMGVRVRNRNRESAIRCFEFL